MKVLYSLLLFVHCKSLTRATKAVSAPKPSLLDTYLENQFPPRIPNVNVLPLLTVFVQEWSFWHYCTSSRSLHSEVLFKRTILQYLLKVTEENFQAIMTFALVNECGGMGSAVTSVSQDLPSMHGVQVWWIRVCREFCLHYMAMQSVQAPIHTNIPVHRWCGQDLLL